MRTSQPTAGCNVRHLPLPLLLLLILLLAAVVVTTVRPGTSAGAAMAQPGEGGGIGLRLMDAPVAAGDDPRARIYIVDHLAPGAVIERRVEVSNTTVVDEEITLYAAAASIDGGTFVGAEGHTPNDLASWTSVTPSSTTVVPGGLTTATVTIAVPADAAPGEQYGVVWAEARSGSATGDGVTQVSRVGIRLYVSVGAGGPPAADFAVESLTAERTAGGEPVISAAVRNTGGRALDLQGTLTLANGPGGLSAGPFPAELGSTVAIGDTQPVRITLDGRLPNGPWDATVTFASGLTERSAGATITFPEAGAAAPVTATAPGTAPDRAPPWTLIIGATAAAVVLVAAALGDRRRGKRRPQHRKPRRRRHSRATPEVPLETFPKVLTG